MIVRNAKRVSSTPMNVRIARLLEETFEHVRSECHITTTNGRISGNDMRAMVSDFIDTYGDDKEAQATFRALPAAERQRLLRQAMPGTSYRV